MFCIFYGAPPSSDDDELVVGGLLVVGGVELLDEEELLEDDELPPLQGCVIENDTPLTVPTGVDVPCIFTFAKLVPSIHSITSSPSRTAPFVIRLPAQFV